MTCTHGCDVWRREALELYPGYGCGRLLRASWPNTWSDLYSVWVCKYQSDFKWKKLKIFASALCPLSTLWDLFKRVVSAQWSDARHGIPSLSCRVGNGRNKSLFGEYRLENEEINFKWLKSWYTDNVQALLMKCWIIMGNTITKIGLLNFPLEMILVINRN